MDNSTAIYISEKFSPELKDEILKSFQLFEDFELQNYEEDFIEIIMTGTVRTTEDTQDLFILNLHEKLDYIINEHSLKLDKDTTLYFKNELLTGLKGILNIEDSLPYIRILESLENNEQKFATIISDITSLSEMEVLETVVELSPVMMTSLKSYLLTKDIDIPTTLDPELIKRVSCFFEVYQEETIGKQMASICLLGQTFSSYLPFIKDDILSGDQKQIALDILSVMIFSIDCYKDLLSGYRNYSDSLFTDIRQSSAIQEYVIQYCNKFNEVWSIQIEKNRLSQASH